MAASAGKSRKFLSPPYLVGFTLALFMRRLLAPQDSLTLCVRVTVYIFILVVGRLIVKWLLRDGAALLETCSLKKLCLGALCFLTSYRFLHTIDYLNAMTLLCCVGITCFVPKLLEQSHR